MSEQDGKTPRREVMTQLDRIEAKLNYLMIKGFGWEEFVTTNAELEEWEVK
jgi:hypothetical protein